MVNTCGLNKDCWKQWVQNGKISVYPFTHCLTVIVEKTLITSSSFRFVVNNAKLCFSNAHHECDHPFAPLKGQTENSGWTFTEVTRTQVTGKTLGAKQTPDGWQNQQNQLCTLVETMFTEFGNSVWSAPVFLSGNPGRKICFLHSNTKHKQLTVWLTLKRSSTLNSGKLFEPRKSLIPLHRRLHYLINRGTELITCVSLRKKSLSHLFQRKVCGWGPVIFECFTLWIIYFILSSLLDLLNFSALRKNVNLLGNCEASTTGLLEFCVPSFDRCAQ